MFENFEIEVCNIFKKAESIKNKLNHEYVGTEHLLLAILDSDRKLAKSLKGYGINYEKFYSDIDENLEKCSSKSRDFTPLLKEIIMSAMKKDGKVTSKDLVIKMIEIGEGVALRILMTEDVDIDAVYNYLKEQNDNLELYKYGTILNESVNLQERVIGRDKEIDLIIETLLRKKKNNPLLVGEAGVGKSAIVEELARRIVQNKVPSMLLDKIIFSLNIASLLAGTRYRGEFEERVNRVINEVIENGNIILFIDEVHTMVGAGDSEGAIGASDILKPYLARGDIKCIAATTKKEYEASILKDKALNRRFERILINEPTEEETFEIIKGIKEEYSNFHKINISDEMIKNLVHIASIYFPDKKNPDKSVELLDSVMSYVKLKENKEVIQAKEENIKKISLAKAKMLEEQNYKEALKNKVLENKLKNELKLLKTGANYFIKEDDIIDVLEYKNNIILKSNKIKNIHHNLGSNYDSKILNLITKPMKENNGPSSYLFIGDSKSFIKDIAKELNFEIFNLNNDDNIPTLFHKIKYYPSQIIVAKENASSRIINLLNKIIKDKLVEYEDEYYSFNSVVVIILSDSNSLGFVKNNISKIPVNEVINFNKKINFLKNPS